jgi:S-DNA-T family DNA segregation ATPase FtsK/SpoIIIE
VVVAWVLVAAAARIWRDHGRGSFDRRVLRRWRRTFVYGWRWRRAMVTCDLARPGRWWSDVPGLGAVWSTRWTDTVSVQPLDGQGAAAFAARTDELAWMLGAMSCTVRPDAAGVVRLELRRGDPLARPVPALPVDEAPDLDALRLGVREDGRPWTVALGQGHLLVVGGAGTGSGSVVWSLVRALSAPARAGTVELWGADGSGGLHLGAGEAMFTRLALDGPADGAALLADATALLHERSGPGDGARPYLPTAGHPLVVLVLDEVARWGPALDDVLRRRLAGDLELLLTHGRAAGVVVVATTPVAAPALASRFHHRVTLQPEAAPRLGPPGVGIAVTGDGPPVRVRAAGVDDREIAAMAAAFAPADSPGGTPPAGCDDDLALRA